MTLSANQDSWCTQELRTQDGHNQAVGLKEPMVFRHVVSFASTVCSIFSFQGASVFCAKE